MLQLKNIVLTQFKNYLQRRFVFTHKVVGICGNNGIGKTNLLDAIYYLSFTKSYFSSSDAQNVHNGLQGLRLQGTYELHNASHELVAILRENNKKEFLVDAVPMKKFSDHIGNYPCVMIAPDDVQLILGGSEERRKFIDTLLSQMQRPYLHSLIEYNKLLQQRNSLLKQMAELPNDSQAGLLQVLNAQMAARGNFIFQTRQAFLADFLPLVLTFYTTIAGKQDEVNISYESKLQQQPMEALLDAYAAKDLLLQRSNVGIHKDDIVLSIGSQAFKNQASQGQRKSLLFALKLAEWQTLKNNKGFAPFLLLDDVFEKLDAERMHNLLQWVCTDEDGQVFITDTHAARLTQALSNIGIEHQLIEL